MAKTPAMLIDYEGNVWSPQGLIAHSDSKREMEYLNSLGVDQSITTLTSVLPQVIRQKRHTTPKPLESYVKFAVGQGNPFTATLFNWKVGIAAGAFENGLIEMASHDSNKAGDDIWVEPISRYVTTWKKDVTYNIINTGTFAAGSQLLEYTTENLKARKELYDKGIQDMTFWGLSSNVTKFPGLLNQSGVSINTTLITKYLKDMTTAEFNNVLGEFIQKYRENCNYTAYPDKFLIPEIDFNGLAKQYSEVNGARVNRLQMLEEALSSTAMRKVEVLPSVYAMATNNAAISGLNKDRYVLYNSDEDSVIVNVPIYFTVTMPGTCNNFDYTSAAYSRFTGVNTLRPLEMLYLDKTAPST